MATAASYRDDVYMGFRFVRMSQYCPMCDETEDKSFPLYNIHGEHGCEGCVENADDERSWWKANADDMLQR